MSMPVMPSSTPVAAVLPDANPAMPGMPVDESASAGSNPFASLLREKIDQAADPGKMNVDPLALLLPETDTTQAPSPEALPPLFAMLSASDAMPAALLASGVAAEAGEAKTGKGLLTADLLLGQRPQAKMAPADTAIADAQVDLAGDFQAANPANGPAKPATSFDAMLQAAANLAVGQDGEKPLSQTQLIQTDLAQPQSAAVAPLSEKHMNMPAASDAKQISTPVGHEGWADEVGDRLVWMSKGQESKAELILTPPQLGKIEISLNISGEQASISFVSANPQVREAIENAMNRLREVLAEGGIQLGQANVGAESFSSQAQDRRNGDNPGNRVTHADAMGDNAIHVNIAWGSQGTSMVDTFA